MQSVKQILPSVCLADLVHESMPSPLQQSSCSLSQCSVLVPAFLVTLMVAVWRGLRPLGQLVWRPFKVSTMVLMVILAVAAAVQPDQEREIDNPELLGDFHHQPQEDSTRAATTSSPSPPNHESGDPEIPRRGRFLTVQESQRSPRKSFAKSSENSETPLILHLNNSMHIAEPTNSLLMGALCVAVTLTALLTGYFMGSSRTGVSPELLSSELKVWRQSST